MIKHFPSPDRTAATSDDNNSSENTRSGSGSAIAALRFCSVRPSVGVATVGAGGRAAVLEAEKVPSQNHSVHSWVVANRFSGGAAFTASFTNPSNSEGTVQ